MVKSWVQPVAQDRESTKWTIQLALTLARWGARGEKGQLGGSFYKSLTNIL